MKAILLLLLLAALSGCASYDKAGLASDIDGAGQDGGSRAGTDLLYAHDVVAAQSAFAASDDRAGEAITALLLLPYSAPATRLIKDHLGGRDALDAQGDVLWGDQGLAYFISRGVAWADSPSTVGIKTLLVDRLPWSRRQLDSVDGFVSGLNRPVGLAAEALVGIAEELANISDALTDAVAAPGFESFFLPGQVFHDEELDLTLAKPELSALKAVVEGGRAVLYFVAAYEHAWTLERALGETVWLDVASNPMDPDHIEGAVTIDYQAAHLNESLGRAVHSVAYLADAREAAAASMGAVAEGLRFGAEQTTESAFDWRRADDELALQVAEFFDALAAAMDAPTQLPHMTPAVTADLSRVFEGRTLGPEQNLLFVDRWEDEFGVYESLSVDEDALTAWTDGVFDPALDSAEFTLANESSDLFEIVTGDVVNSFEASTSSSF